MTMQDKDNMEYLLFNKRKKIYVCLNHRAAYLCWIDANKKGFVKDSALLFHIDYHADFWLHKKSLIDEEGKIDINDMDGLKEFVRTKLSVQNSEFIVLSMYRGIIGDAISISRKNDSIYGTPEKGSYRTTDRHWFKDRKDNIHNFYLGGHWVMKLTGHNGLLTDGSKHWDVQRIFGAHSRNQNLILDLDLDFFTYQSDEGQDWAMNERHLNTIFQSADFGYLFNHIDVISIALEPSCCGGNEECISILDKLNSLVLKKYSFDIKDEVIQKFGLDR